MLTQEKGIVNPYFLKKVNKKTEKKEKTGEIPIYCNRSHIQETGKGRLSIQRKKRNEKNFQKKSKKDEKRC